MFKKAEKNLPLTVECIDALNKLQLFASTDVLTFPQCVKKSSERHGDIIQKAKDYNNRPMKEDSYASSPMSAAINTKKHWNNRLAEQVYKSVQDEKAAMCTTFAYSAAHILSQDNPNNCRIEVIAHNKGMGSHVFVIVGREGGYTMNEKKWQLPTISEWPRNFIIVDAWAGAMGYDVIYDDVQEYPYPTMLENLELIMASDIIDTEV